MPAHSPVDAKAGATSRRDSSELAAKHAPGLTEECPRPRTIFPTSFCVVFGDRPERRLGLPGHVRIGGAVAAFENLDDAEAGQVEIVAWVAVGTVGKMVEGEKVDEGAVDSLAVEDVEQFVQVGRLTGLVALVDAVEPQRRARDRVQLEHLHAARGVVPGPFPCGRPEPGDGDRQAIVAAVTAEREARIAAAVAARLDGVTLADAVIGAVITEYNDPGDDAGDALLMITASPALRTCYVESVNDIEEPLATALVQRNGRLDMLSARVLAASVGAAVRVALHEWMRSAPDRSGNEDLVVLSGSLPDILRTALASLAPALDAAVASAPQSTPVGIDSM